MLWSGVGEPHNVDRGVTGSEFRSLRSEALMKRMSLSLLALLVVVGSCTPATDATTSRPSETTVPIDTTVTTSPTTTQTTTPPGVELDMRPFGSLVDIPLLSDSDPYAGPGTPASLTNVTVPAPLGEELADPALRGRLESLGFAVVPGEARLFHHVYGVSEYDPYPVFVTTDAALNAWHLVFDKVLRETEERHLLPALERLVLGLVEEARAQREELAGTTLADPADRAVQFYEAAATLLELDVGAIGSLASDEVALALGAETVGTSPTLGTIECSSESPGSCVFYELFKPRGHYTRTPELERYFRAMSLLGNGPITLDPDSLMVGIMLARPLVSDRALAEDWHIIYEPTSFLVGAADDYTPFELAAAAAEVTPDGVTAPVELSDPAVLEEIAARMRARRPVAINPEAASVRMMGVRLTLDSFIIDQLVFPNVDRYVASVRDVAAAFGSDWALRSMEADGYASYDGYAEQLEELRGAVDRRTIEDWSRTVYDAWLYALDATWAERGAAFPDFMQTEEWTAKAHQAGFGSYAELKHDTILYTKQAMAEGGNGAELPPPPIHWVEPDPVVFERLAAAAELLREGLDTRELIDSTISGVIVEFQDGMALLARVARSELSAEPITEEDNLRLQRIGSWLEGIWLYTSDLDVVGVAGGPDEEAALVADIFRSVTEGALEVATGRVDSIYVVVPDGDGGFQVAKGGVYSFYEFWQEPSDRLTDEEWRALLDAGAAPDRPDWADVFLVQ